MSGVDADRFLIELAQKLQCWPPSICTNPIGHLLAELEPVADYPTVPEKEVNILLTVRSRLAELEKSEQEREQATREMVSDDNERIIHALAQYRSDLG